MLSNEHKQFCLRLLSGCRHAHAASVVGSVAMRWLRRADLGTEEIACRTAQNLYSLHRSRRPGKLMQTFAVAFGVVRMAQAEKRRLIVLTNFVSS